MAGKNPHLRLVKTDVVRPKALPASPHRPFSLHPDAGLTGDMLGHMPGLPPAVAADMLNQAGHAAHTSVHGMALNAGY